MILTASPRSCPTSTSAVVSFACLTADRESKRWNLTRDLGKFRLQSRSRAGKLLRVPRSHDNFLPISHLSLRALVTPPRLNSPRKRANREFGESFDRDASVLPPCRPLARMHPRDGDDETRSTHLNSITRTDLITPVPAPSTARERDCREDDTQARLSGPGSAMPLQVATYSPTCVTRSAGGPRLVWRSLLIDDDSETRPRGRDASRRDGTASGRRTTPNLARARANCISWSRPAPTYTSQPRAAARIDSRRAQVELSQARIKALSTPGANSVPRRCLFLRQPRPRRS